MSNAIYTDPNCTAFERWTAWREAIHGDLEFGPAAAGYGQYQSTLAQAADQEAERLGLGTDESEACTLGVATLLLSHVARSWRGGRFFAALQVFALLHDGYLTNLHPGFYESSAWPLYDSAVQDWKETFIFQVRRFRELAGRKVSLGQAAFSKDAIPDAVERENLGSVGGHIFQQLTKRELRQRWTNSSRWQPTKVSEELVTWWEVTPLAALVPGPLLRQPVMRVYVYSAKEVPGLRPLVRSPAFCHYRQWGMDVGFHDFFQSSALRTLDPFEADYFFVPTYACCHQLAGLYEFDKLDRLHVAAVNQLPFFRRSRGADHIFSLHYIDLFPSWRQYIPNSVVLTPETEVGFERSLNEFSLDQSRHPPFNAAKDLSVPPYINPRDILGFARNSRPVADRENLAAFAGKLWQDVAEAAEVRGRVAALAGRPGMDIHAFASIAQMLGNADMHAMMGNARFCFVPRGRAAWSVRFFESILAGCVPVLLSDHYRPPFEALFDVTEFVIKWPVTRIDSTLLDFLASIPISVVEQYALAAKRVRCWYLYPPPEVAWLGNWQSRRELDQVEDEVCPNLSSSRNAFQAVAEILTRRVQATKAPVSFFYIPDPNRGHEPTLVDTDLSPV